MRYFLDIRDGKTLIRDPDGTEFPTLDAAQAEALKTVRKLLADGIRSGLDMWTKRLEVSDRAGMILAVLPFAPIFEVVEGGVGDGREVRPHVRPPPGPDTTARRFTERMRLALALRLAVRNAPRIPGLSGLPAEGLAIDPDLADDAASALEDAAHETWRHARADGATCTGPTVAPLRPRGI